MKGRQCPDCRRGNALKRTQHDLGLTVSCRYCGFTRTHGSYGDPNPEGLVNLSQYLRLQELGIEATPEWTYEQAEEAIHGAI